MKLTLLFFLLSFLCGCAISMPKNIEDYSVLINQRKLNPNGTKTVTNFLYFNRKKEKPRKYGTHPEHIAHAKLAYTVIPGKYNLITEMNYFIPGSKFTWGTQTRFDVDLEAGNTYLLDAQIIDWCARIQLIDISGNELSDASYERLGAHVSSYEAGNHPEIKNAFKVSSRGCGPKGRPWKKTRKLG